MDELMWMHGKGTDTSTTLSDLGGETAKDAKHTKPRNRFYVVP